MVTNIIFWSLIACSDFKETFIRVNSDDIVDPLKAGCSVQISSYFEKDDNQMPDWPQLAQLYEFDLRGRKAWWIYDASTSNPSDMHQGEKMWVWSDDNELMQESFYNNLDRSYLTWQYEYLSGQKIKATEIYQGDINYDKTSTWEYDDNNHLLVYENVSDDASVREEWSWEENSNGWFVSINKFEDTILTSSEELILDSEERVVEHLFDLNADSFFESKELFYREDGVDVRWELYSDNILLSWCDYESSDGVDEKVCADIIDGVTEISKRIRSHYLELTGEVQIFTLIFDKIFTSSGEIPLEELTLNELHQYMWNCM